MQTAGKFHILYDSDAGSSGKGAAISRLAEVLGIMNFSCNHGPNAGHIVESPEGKRMLFKILPSPCALRPMGKDEAHNHIAWIGPNSAFEVEQLMHELSMTGYKLGEDVFVHSRAAVTQDHHKAAESPSGSLSTLHVSSTMSGAGATYAMKAMRQMSTPYASEALGELSTVLPQDFFRAVRRQLDIGNSFLHEVAQGFALSLDYGIQPRHCTYRNPSALQGAADMGITPNYVGEVYANLRSFPIRVGNNFDANGKQVGYSGNWWPDQYELDWNTIGKNAGMPEEEIKLLYSKELTTVTKKLRRVASFSKEGLKYSTAFNGATALILNFSSYLDWESTDKKGGREEYLNLSSKVRSFVDELEEAANLPVVMIGTGAKHDSYILPYDSVGLTSSRPSREFYNRSVSLGSQVAQMDADLCADSGS
jgi:adenylosuccinate synthase